MEGKGKIVEIFKSVQGEGKFIGLPQIFLRLSLCNLQCTYCDTDFHSGTWMGTEEVVRSVERLLNAHPEVHCLSVTGGEPLLQSEFLQKLLPGLRQRAAIFLETNGTIVSGLVPILRWVDIISMDIKLASASLTEDCWQQHREFLEISKTKDTYVKVVLSGQTTDEDVEKAVALVAAVSPRMCFVLRPVTPLGLATAPAAAQMEKWMQAARSLLADVRVVPQMHKQWGIP